MSRASQQAALGGDGRSHADPADLLRYGESYFFREESARNSLVASGGVLLDLIDVGRGARVPEVRHAAQVLAVAAEDLVETIVSQYSHLAGGSDADPADVLRCVADDHQHAPLGLRSPG